MRICLVVSGAGDLRAVLEAVGAEVADAVWVGDPQLRPRLAGGVRWIDVGLAEPTGVGWNRLLTALDPEAYALARATRSVAARLAAEPASTLLLRVGDVVVIADTATEPPPTGMAAVPRVTAVPPADGLAPSPADVATHGRWGTAALWFGPEAASAAAAIADALAGSAGGSAAAGGVLAAALDAAGVGVLAAAGTVAGWSPPADGAVVDITQLGRAGGAPTFADFGGRPARHSVADQPELLGLLDRHREQWHGHPVPLRLPGGVAVDAAIRNVTAAAIARWRAGSGELPPEPFGPTNAEFLAWLESPWPPWGPDIGRYWSELWHLRPDVAAAYPLSDADGLARFAAWAADTWRHEGRSRLIEPRTAQLRPLWHDRGRQPGGVNLVGYVTVDSSLGNLARRLIGAFDAVGIAHVALDYHRTGSPALPDPPTTADGPRYDTNLLVVNPDQLGALAADHGAVLFPGRRTIAFWHWDIEYVPPSLAAAVREHSIDEVWVLTEFTRAALAGELGVPVRVVCPAVPEAQPSAATRAELGLPDHRFVFLAVLDHLSLTERKNPLGAVAAFRRAFPTAEPGGPVLVVKTTNRAHRWADHERIRVAAAGRPDIVVVDRHLSRGDQIALVHRSDCLVSLHRSEGLGLHLMEAMWAGRPTIATRYSGNLAFQDDSNTALVDARLVAVGDGGEGFFPPHAEWADPDLDQAAGWMRRLAEEPELAARMGAAGRATMERQPTLADTGRLVAGLLDLECGRIGAP
jgi:glycosyltransferase involved in cell wall biosynthesis